MVLLIMFNAQKVKENQHDIVYYVKCAETKGAST